jgi:lipid-binding SYLF domain-containing protein
VDSLLSKFEIGGEESAAAGPVGRSASASTDARLNAQMLLLAHQRSVAGLG